MRTRILYTEGKGYFVETVWDKPSVEDNEIAVKSIMTGVCRSDIDMMEGNFGPLPIDMSGHEGLARVIEVGKYLTNMVSVGDIVATRGEPAYADYYNVRRGEFVRVPEAKPKYILEPVACGINLVRQARQEIERRTGSEKRLLILGSGMLAWVAFHALKEYNFTFDIDVVGSHNHEIWGDKLKSSFDGTYDVIIDLSGKQNLFNNVLYNDNALLIIGTQQQTTTDFSKLLWKAVTVIFPSPRNSQFIVCMEEAARWIEQNDLNVDQFWTRGYSRETEWAKAFYDGAHRPVAYSRGYIYWE